LEAHGYGWGRGASCSPMLLASAPLIPSNQLSFHPKLLELEAPPNLPWLLRFCPENEPVRVERRRQTMQRGKSLRSLGYIGVNNFLAENMGGPWPS
jgi:hypothetical protein